MGLFKRNNRPVEAVIAAGSSGFGEPLHIVFEKRPLTVGEGANVFAYDTLALPRYTPIGWGVQPRRQLRPNQGAQVASTQGITIQTLGSPGNVSGQIVTQQLVDTSQGQPFVAGNSQPNVISPGSLS